jgi:hypothetical protein
VRVRYYPFTGLIDDTRIWNVAKSGADLTQMQCSDPCGFGGDCAAGLMHFWRFDESFGQTVTNMVPGARGGHLVGNVVRVEHDLCDKTGCTDPAATNFDQGAGSYDHTCEYSKTGAVDFTHGRLSSAMVRRNHHVAHIGVPDLPIGSDSLPTKAMTAECWVKFVEPFVEWAAGLILSQ